MNDGTKPGLSLASSAIKPASNAGEIAPGHGRPLSKRRSHLLPPLSYLLPLPLGSLPILLPCFLALHVRLHIIRGSVLRLALPGCLQKRESHPTSFSLLPNSDFCAILPKKQRIR
jgi:hypothetical protein